jgi:hypothetical protein
MNILFLAQEGEARPIGRLAIRYKSAGHKVLVASVSHFDVTHSSGEMFDHLRELGLAESEIAHLESVYREMNRQPLDLSREAIDFDYLRRFESKYCKRFSLWRMTAMDQMMLRVFHHRNYYFHPKNKNLFLKNIELQAKWLDEIFSRMQFDLVITINFQYFLKALAYNIADACAIPYLMVSGCRVRDIHLLSENYGVGTPPRVIEEMQRLVAAGDLCADAVAYIDETKETGQAAYIGGGASQRLRRPIDNLRDRLRELRDYLLRYPSKALFIDKHYRGIFRRNYYLPSYFSVLGGMIVRFWRYFAFYSHKGLTRTDLPDGPFVYFPLHLIPESSVLVLSDTLNELDCVFQLSKALPVDWRIVVKVNANMILDGDTHPNSYYLQFDRIQNVQFINPAVPSATIIQRAAAVASISGTALLEAAIYDKPSIRWGKPEFDVIDTIMKFEPEDVRDHITRPSPSRNLKFFIQACFNLGMRLDLNMLIEGRTEDNRQQYDREIELIERSINDYWRTNVA